LTNAQKLAADTNHMADFIYGADDFDDICKIGFDEDGEPLYLPECEDPESCLKCIKKWLNKEVADGEN